MQVPSRGGLATAKALAVLSGHLVHKDAENPLISKQTWDEMHKNPTVGYPLGGLTTYFTQVTYNKNILNVM